MACEDTQVPRHHVEGSLPEAGDHSPLALDGDTGVPDFFLLVGVVNLVWARSDGICVRWPEK